VPIDTNIDNRGIGQTPIGAAWRFRWIVVALSMSGAVGGFLFANAIKSTQYQATASLVVTDPRATTLFSADEASRLSADRYVEDQVAILRSDSVAKRTSELASLALSGTELDAIEIEEGLRISADEGSEILVQYSAADEATAVAVTNSVIKAYELVRNEEAVRESSSAVAQLEQSLGAIDNELSQIEAMIVETRQSPELTELDRQRADALEQLVTLQPQLTTATGDELTAVRQKLADIDLLLARVAQITTAQEDNPRLVQLYQQQEEAVRRRSSLAQQRDQLLVDTELLSGGISLSSPAQFARQQTTAVAALVILGAILGFVAGVGLAFVLAKRRRRFSRRGQPGWVLHAALLAEIPVFGDEGIHSELPVLEHPASASAEAFRFAATALALQRPRQTDRGAETAGIPRTYLVTSDGPGTGKTVLTANLALAAARKGHSVLAIDADFGSQRLSTLLHGDVPASRPGITEIVESGVDLVSATISLGEPGPLHLLSRGNRPTTAPDFFSMPATQAFIAKVARLYDLVLIDGPPMLHVAYSSVLAQYVDRVIVVARHGASVSRLEDLAQRLELIGTPLAGYVYNGAPLRWEMTITEGSLQDVLGGGTNP
jgi:Mrp family chromosome partitioning ATPase/uncharacterized protein involved in exopolysaccharide biosynthesis